MEERKEIRLMVEKHLAERDASTASPARLQLLLPPILHRLLLSLPPLLPLSLP
jgi:hypothetical protein